MGGELFVYRGAHKSTSLTTTTYHPALDLHPWLAMGWRFGGKCLTPVSRYAPPPPEVPPCSHSP